MRFRLKNGRSLRYHTRGVGPVLLLLHPVGLRLEFWAPVVKLLEGQFRLISVDTIGHGESDVPQAPFNLDQIASDMRELCDVLAPSGFVAVGCSMGGMVAQAMAAQVEYGGLRGVVIANTAHLRNDQGRAAMQKRADEAALGMSAIIAGTLDRWFDAPTQKAQPDIVEKAREWLENADPIVHSWSWMAIRDLAYADRLKVCPLPALAIAASRDQSTPVSTVKAMAESFPNGSFKELDTGHLAPLEDPATFADFVRAFVNDIVSTA